MLKNIMISSFFNIFLYDGNFQIQKKGVNP